MDQLSSILGVLIAVGTLLSLVFAGLFYLIRSTINSILDKFKAELVLTLGTITDKLNLQSVTFAQLRLEILDSIDKKLDDYVRNQNYRDYVEAHAREHLRMESEITKLREFKHDTDGFLRELSTKLEDLKERLNRLDNLESEGERK